MKNNLGQFKKGHARDSVEVLYKLINYLNQSRGLVVINQSELNESKK